MKSSASRNVIESGPAAAPDADQQAMTVGIYLYRLAFDFSDFGGASALAWIMFGIIALLTWLTNKAFAERQVRP